ncbi:TPA: hypothetical protein ACGZ99_001208 [Elizabethkingia anophelis]
MLNLKAHKTLKILYKHFNDGEKKSKGGWVVGIKGRSFTTIELHEKTHYSVNTINEICLILEQNEHIKLHEFNNEFKVYRYHITPKGMEAFVTKHYIFSLLDIVVKWIPIAVSVLSLFVAIIVAWYTIHNSKSIEKLQNQTIEMQKKVKTLESLQRKTN